MTRYQVEEHLGPGAFDALVPEWNDLLARSVAASVYQTLPLVRGAWRMTQDRTTPRILVVRTESGVIAGLLALGDEVLDAGPLATHALRCIAPRFLDFNDVLYDESHRSAVADSLGAHLQDHIRRGHLFDLRPVPEGSLLHQIGMTLRRNRTVHQHGRRVTALPPAPATWTSVIRSGSARREIQRGWRRLSESYGVEVRHAVTADAVRSLGESFRHIFSEEQARKERDSALNTPTAIAWWPEFLQELHRDGTLVLIGLCQGERMIAGYIMLRFRGRAIAFRTAFDDAWHGFGPGMLALTSAVDLAIREGDSHLDFGLGDERYKDRWGDPAPGFVRVTAAPRTLRYLTLQAWKRLRATG